MFLPSRSFVTIAASLTYILHILCETLTLAQEQLSQKQQTLSVSSHKYCTMKVTGTLYITES